MRIKHSKPQGVSDFQDNRFIPNRTKTLGGVGALFFQMPPLEEDPLRPHVNLFRKMLSGRVTKSEKCTKEKILIYGSSNQPLRYPVQKITRGPSASSLENKTPTKPEHAFDLSLPADDFYDHSICYCPTLNRMAVFNKDNVFLVTFENTRPARIFPLSTTIFLERNRPTSISFSPKGDYFLVATASGDLYRYDEKLTINGTTHTWWIDTQPDSEHIVHLPLIISEPWIYIGFPDGSIKKYNSSTGTEELPIESSLHSQIHGMALSPNGKYLVTGGEDGVIKLFDLEQEKEISTLKTSIATIKAITFSPCGNFFATGSGQAETTISIWKYTNTKIMRVQVQYVAAAVSTIFWTGNLLLSTHTNGKFLLFKIDLKQTLPLSDHPISRDLQCGRITHAALKEEGTNKSLIAVCPKSQRVISWKIYPFEDSVKQDTKGRLRHPQIR